MDVQDEDDAARLLRQEREEHRKRIQLNVLEYVYSNVFDPGMVLEVLCSCAEFDVSLPRLIEPQSSLPFEPPPIVSPRPQQIRVNCPR